MRIFRPRYKVVETGWFMWVLGWTHKIVFHYVVEEKTYTMRHAVPKTKFKGYFRSWSAAEKALEKLKANPDWEKI